RAIEIATSEMSTPVTLAPSKAQDRAWSPQEQASWSTRRPDTSPAAAISSASRAEPPEVKNAAGSPGRARWIWFQLARFDCVMSWMLGTDLKLGQNGLASKGITGRA